MVKKQRWKKIIFKTLPLVLSLGIFATSYGLCSYSNNGSNDIQTSTHKSDKKISDESLSKEFNVADLKTTNLDAGWKYIPFNNTTVQFQLRPEQTSSSQYFRNTNLISSNGTNINVDFRNNDLLPFYNGNNLLYSQWAGDGFVQESFVNHMHPNSSLTFDTDAELINLNGVAVQYFNNSSELVVSELLNGFNFERSSLENITGNGGVTPIINPNAPIEFDTINSPIVVNTAVTMPSLKSSGIKLYNVNANQVIQSNMYGYFQEDLTDCMNMFSSQLYDVIQEDSTHTTALYYYQPATSSTTVLDKQSDILLPSTVSDFWKGSKNQLPSEAINNLTTENINSMVNEFKTVFFTNSIMKNSTIEFSANDVEGKIDLKITIPYQIHIKEKSTYLQISQPNKDFVNKVYVMSIIPEPIVKTFSSANFYRSDITTDVINSISMLNDAELANYSVQEILALDDAQQRLKLFVMRHKDRIFNILPNDFSIENIVEVNLIQDETNNSEAQMVVFLDSYFYNGSNPGTIKDFEVTLTDVYEGRTAAVSGEIELENFSEYYAQTSILKSSDASKVGVLNPDWAKTKQESSTVYTILGSDLTDTFKEELLAKCISGKKTGIGIEDIVSIGINWFNNSEDLPSISMSAITLKKYYGNDNRNIINKNITLLNDENKIILTGFKEMDIDPISLNAEFSLNGVNGTYPDKFNKDNLISKINEDLFNSIYLTNSTINNTTGANSFNFYINANYKIGQIKDIATQFSNNEDGTKTINGITAYNVFVKVPGTEQIVFDDEYTFPSQELVINGFRATKNETQIVIPQGIEWDVLASDVKDNLNGARERFLQKFFDECVINPQNTTVNDLSIVVEEVDNTRGYLQGKITLRGSNPPIVDKEVKLYGFTIQQPTRFKQYNQLLPSPSPTMDIYDFTITEAAEIIFDNISFLVDGIPTSLSEEDIYINEDDFVVDYRERCVELSFKLRKFYNDRGELVNDPNLNDPDNPTSYVYRIGLFDVNQPTTNYYNFTYTINDPQESLNEQCYIDPDSFPWLKRYVQQAILNQKELGKLSIPEISTDDFSITLNTDWNQASNKYAYALGEIYLNVLLYKYYDNAGKLIDINPNNNVFGYDPLEIKVKLNGWDVWSTSYLLSAQSVVNWGNGEVNPTDDQIKDILWQHRNEWVKHCLYSNDDQRDAFINNLIIKTKRLIDGGSLSIESTICFRQYFDNGLLKNDESSQLTIIISNFAVREMQTTFTTETSINTDEDAPNYIDMEEIYPSDLATYDISMIPVKFKQLVFDQVITGDKFDMSINNINNIVFGGSSNTDGFVEIVEIEILGYQNSVLPDQLIRKEFLSGIRVGGLRKTTATALKSDNVSFENNTAYKNLFNLNNEQLKLIVQRNIDNIFKQPLPNGTNSVKSVELVNGSQQWIDGTVKIKVTVSSYYNSAGVLQEADKTFPDSSNQSITITNFNLPKPTQMSIVDFDASEAFKDENGKIYPTTIFAEDVIEQNWSWIKRHLVIAINEAFALYPEKFISVSIRNPEDFNEIAWLPVGDEDVNWNFLSEALEQSVKESFSLAAKKAKDSPTNFNNDSYGRIELKVLMLRGIVKNRYGELEDNQPLSEENATLTLRLSGFLTSNHYEQQNWYSNKSLLITILTSSISAIVLILIIAITAIVLRKRSAV